MDGITFIHRIEAPELSAAINNLAEAMKFKPTMPAPVITAEPQPTAPDPAPVQTAAIPTAEPVQQATAQPVVTPAPTVAAPTPAPAQTAATEAPAISFDMITAAGSQLLEHGKMAQLTELLKSFGVQAITQLKPEQYPAVAAGLRNLGAAI